MAGSNSISVKTINKHIGFVQDAPNDVYWSSDAYVKMVASNEQREMCRTHCYIALSALILFLLPAVLVLAGNYLKGRLPQVDSPLWYISMAAVMASGLLLSIVGQFIARRIFVAKVRSREGKLFNPSDGIAVLIEDAFTYDKRKFVVEDFGLLKVLPDCILLEMTRHRAKFDRAGLSVSLLHTAKKNAGIRLIYNYPPYSWTIVVCPIANIGLLSGLTQSAAKSKALLKVFTQLGYQAQSQPEIKQASGLSSVPTITPVSQITPPAEQVEHADILEARYQKIREEIGKKINSRKKSWLINIGILLISLLVFFQLGFFKWGLGSVLLIILVLLIHEMGHFLSMKIFGYKNVQIFFIPLFGAAVSGVSRNISGWKKAIVSLMGPFPGILISIILMPIALITNNRTCLEAGMLFLFINAFNLLPIKPLDGGHFLNELLFSRNRYVEMVVNILAGVGLFALGAAIQSWIFKVLGILNLVTVQVRFKMAAAADNFEKQHAVKEENPADEATRNDSQEYIPEHILKPMLSWIHQNMPGPMKPRDIANIALEIWDRIRIRPSRWAVTILLLFIFFSGFFLSIVSLGIGAIGLYKNARVVSKIIAYQDPNQVTCYKEQQSFMGIIQSEDQLSEDQNLYHGFHRGYYADQTLSEEGWWNMGKRTGRWSYYDPNSLLIEEVIYRDGIPLSIKYLEDDRWKEQRWEDYSDEDKEYYQDDADEQHGPDKELLENDLTNLAEKKGQEN
ncbi:MAG: site-2 protease family protein [Sedimentisphaerales bacterium]|nr:site-2 protease family protein [Sedimentisphaerales bacterium]